MLYSVYLYERCNYSLVLQGLMHLSGRPVAAFDPEGLIFAAGINSEMLKLYDLRSFDKVCYFRYCYFYFVWTSSSDWLSESKIFWMKNLFHFTFGRLNQVKFRKFKKGELLLIFCPFCRVHLQHSNYNKTKTATGLD